MKLHAYEAIRRRGKSALRRSAARASNPLPGVKTGPLLAILGLGVLGVGALVLFSSKAGATEPVTHLTPGHTYQVSFPWNDTLTIEEVQTAMDRQALGSFRVRSVTVAGGTAMIVFDYVGSAPLDLVTFGTWFGATSTQLHLQDLGPVS